MPQWQSKLKEQGYVLTKIDPELSLERIEVALGRVDLIEGISPIQELIPKQGRGVGPSYSDNFGFGEFPFHTDMAHWSVPPRYLALICVCGSSDVATRIVHRSDLLSPEELLNCRRALFKARRPLEGRQTPLRMLDGDVFRWDALFLKPLNRLGNEMVSLVAKRLGEIAARKVTLVAPGEVLILDNWQVLHGRDPIPPDSMKRVLNRVYLKSINYD